MKAATSLHLILTILGYHGGREGECPSHWTNEDERTANVRSPVQSIPVNRTSPPPPCLNVELR